jgi:hypothetical protein
MVAFMALPVLADGPGGCPPQNNHPAGIDVQGYVDGTAQFSSGIVEQNSCEIGLKHVSECNTYGERTSFDCAANVPDSRCGAPSNSCGLDVKQDKWDVGFSRTETCSVFAEQVNANYAVGANDMNSLGGVAICANGAGLNATAAVSNVHQVDTAANYKACGPFGSNATASYSGTQKLDLSANYNTRP